MPAGSPPGGLDRRFLVADRILRNTGSDTSVNYQVAARNNESGVILVGGNNDYVGLMTRGLYGELVQGANLPATNNAMEASAHNKADGGWFVMDGISSVFRNATDDLSAPWTNITPPAATSRDDLIEYNGVLLTFTANLSIPDRDIEFSLDNGITWDSNPGDATGIGTNLERVATNPAQTRLLVTAAGGTSVASTTDQGVPPYAWDLFPYTGGIAFDAAISDDGNRGVVVSSNGQIWTSDGFSLAGSGMIPNDNNPWVSTAVGSTIVSVNYIADMQGFVLISLLGPSVGFIPDADMRQVFVGNYIGGTVSIDSKAKVSDGFQGLWPGTNNEAMVTVREIGQLSKT